MPINSYKFNLQRNTVQVLQYYYIILHKPIPFKTFYASWTVFCLDESYKSTANSLSQFSASVFISLSPKSVFNPEDAPSSK